MKNHINIVRHIILAWFILFSLSSCTVKEAIFHLTNNDYAKPLNKSKTSIPRNNCSYSQNRIQQISFVKKARIKEQFEFIAVPVNQFFRIISVKIHINYSTIFSGNSPPKYILYKRLKIDIV